ncbi:MAG: hypothetical protein ABEJ87_00355 [Candidatus Nanohalobium sp.]
MRLSVVLLVSLALLASGCASLGGGMTTEQKFKSQLQDMTQSNYHVKYKISASGKAGILEGAVQTPEIYSKGGQSKFVAGFSFGIASGQIAAYDIFSESPVICTTSGSSYGMGSQTGPQCSVSSSNVSFSKEKIDRFMKNISLEMKGTETVAGRKCNMYEITSAENLTDRLPDQASQYGQGKVNICLDSGKGYPAIISVKANQTSQIRESEGLTEVFRLEVKEYNTDFPDGVFEVPVDAAASLSCDPFEATVTTFDYSGQIKISVNGGENMTRQVEADSKETFSLDSSKKDSFSNEITVYTDSGESHTASCYGSIGGPNY